MSASDRTLTTTTNDKMMSNAKLREREEEREREREREDTSGDRNSDILCEGQPERMTDSS